MYLVVIILVTFAVKPSYLPDSSAVILQDEHYYLEEMHQPPTNAGALPLQEYRRDVPPGWNPGDPAYPLRTYFEKLRLWYRVCSVEDELVGPLIAGRLYGRAAKIAMSLRVPRPDGTYDIGDSALVRLSVEEARPHHGGHNPTSYTLRGAVSDNSAESCFRPAGSGSCYSEPG